MSDKEKEKVKIRRMMVEALVVIFVAAVIILFYFGVARYEGLSEGWNNFVGVWQAIIFGLIIAFLINPIMKTIDKRLIVPLRKVCKTEESAKRKSRGISSIIALIIGIAIVVLVLVAIIPELYRTLVFLVGNLAEQINAVLDWANEITGRRFEDAILSVKGSKVNEAIDAGLKWIQEQLLALIDLSDAEGVLSLVSNVVDVGKTFFNVIIGCFVAVYVLISKEQFEGQIKKILYATLKTSYANNVMKVLRRTRDVFYGFIIGKIIDSTIIGIICYISMLIMRMPYPLLVSVIIGVTNVIPVFGPYIGAVPTVIIIFLTNPKQGIYFLIYILVLQQIDGYAIGPKILGDSTGLSSFWVVVAIVVGGGLFGVPGMLIGVPTMSVIYYIISEIVSYLLRKKGLPEATKDYINLEQIDETTNEMIEHGEDYRKRKQVKIFANMRAKKKDEPDKQ